MPRACPSTKTPWITRARSAPRPLVGFGWRRGLPERGWLWSRRVEPRKRRAQGVETWGVGISVAFDDAPDCRYHRGELVGGEVNCRHGLDINRATFVQQGDGRHCHAATHLGGARFTDLVAKPNEGRELMAKRPKTKTPIMTPDDERFMAFEGLVQWTETVVMQSARVSEADARQLSSSGFDLISTPQQRLRAQQQRRQAVHAFHSECHFFAIAAYKLLEYRDWALTFGLCASVDFGEVDQFPARDIKDLRDMREHVVDYFGGIGREPGRWTVETPEHRGDASGRSGTMIGSRLDWVAFGAAAQRLLPQLLAEPIPYPTRKPGPP